MVRKSLEFVRNARKRRCSKCGDIIPFGAECVKYSCDRTGGFTEIHEKRFWCMKCEKGMEQ